MTCTHNCNQGRECSCGQRQAMFRPTYDIEGPHSNDCPSLLASRWFWIAALVSSLLWVLADYLLSVYWPH